ncbi:MAG: hypothetical protein BHV91_04225 [Clostridiales bacterium 44_9]|nr:MAG: hypothetical protein BHV91_04225 [Clostridiales bacterium 44_9]
MGIAYVKNGQTAEAIKLGKKAYEHGMDAERKLMQLYLNDGNYKEAIIWGRRYDEKYNVAEAKERFEQLSAKFFDKGYAAYEKKLENDYKDLPK